VPSSNPSRSPTHNPATGELLGRFADGSEAEARAAVGAARRAIEVTAWGRNRALRSRMLELAEQFEARAPGTGFDVDARER
jgi:betaine-aldehyde dehydrogenase